MCLLCDDESVYRAYMDYLDEMERRGEGAGRDRAQEPARMRDTASPRVADTTLSLHTPAVHTPAVTAFAAPRSPFVCDQVDE